MEKKRTLCRGRLFPLSMKSVETLESGRVCFLTALGLILIALTLVQCIEPEVPAGRRLREIVVDDFPEGSLFIGATDGSDSFTPGTTNDSLVMDFAEIDDVSLWTNEAGHFARQHYAFKVDETEFDAIFGRVQAEGLKYGSGPGPDRLYDMQVEERRGGHRVYFDELNGHSIEIFTA